VFQSSWNPSSQGREHALMLKVSSFSGSEKHCRFNEGRGCEVNWSCSGTVLVQLNGRTAGFHKGKFQFLDRRNQMLARERGNARRFARFGEKNSQWKCQRDIGKIMSRKIKGVLDKNSGYETLCRIYWILWGGSFNTFNIEELTKRGFSKYRTMLSENRCWLTFENLCMVSSIKTLNEVRLKYWNIYHTYI
jgi:hypothetical protein